MTYVATAFIASVFALVTAGATASDIRVNDDTGSPLELTQPAERIVSLAPHVTEMLYAAGAGDRIVGAVSYSDYPPEAREIPQIGSYKRFDYERITALKPDLIVGWQSGNPADALQQLRQLGFNLYLSEPRALEDIASNIERLAGLAGTEDVAAPNVSRFREGLAALRNTYQDARPVTLFYEVWNEPLTTLNGEHLFSNVAELCGGRNVFADLSSLAPVIGVESVLAKNPQVILASGMNEQRPEWLDDWLRWPNLQAVKRNHLYFVPPDIIQRHTPRVLQGAKLLCEHLEKARQDYYGNTPNGNTQNQEN